MTIKEFLSILEKTDNSLLKSMASEIPLWQKIRSNFNSVKDYLEFFLSKNIAVIRAKTKYGVGEYLVSSNPVFLHYLNGQRIEKNKNKVVRLIKSNSKFSNLLKTKNNQRIRTWDLIKNEKMDVDIDKNLAICRMIGLNDNNLEQLSIEVNSIISKGKNSKNEYRA